LSRVPSVFYNFLFCLLPVFILFRGQKGDKGTLVFSFPLF
jgi:hypothetical protein